MAVILVDFENVVNTNGLHGINYLSESDTLYLFYSDSCRKLRQEQVNFIEQSGCNLKSCKLLQPRKNGLDFCIAVEVGRLIEQGEKNIAIISKDKGYHAITDYIKANQIKGITLVITGSVENALLGFNYCENAARKKIITQAANTSDIADVSKKIALKWERKAAIAEVLKGTEYEYATDRIQRICEGEFGQLRKLYITMLHELGREAGTAVYRLIRDNILSISRQ